MTIAYQVLGDRRAVATANRRFLHIFRDRADQLGKQTIGTPGSSDVLVTAYSRSLDLWVAAKTLGNRYWNAFGCGDPFVGSKVAPIVEINPPLAAGRSKTAAFFLTSPDGRIEVAHTGGLAGGKPGVGKHAFHAYHPLHDRVLVAGKLRDVYLLGCLDEPDELTANVADFVRTVRDFKADLTSTMARPPVDPGFHPEFEGTTTYSVTSSRSATYTHGRVINALYRELTALGISTRRTRQIDLFAAPTNTRRGVIFEAKTGTDPQSIFTCLGQLMYLPPSPAWQKIAVLPMPVTTAVKDRLAELGVGVLEYDITERGLPAFQELRSLIAALAKDADGAGGA